MTSKLMNNPYKDLVSDFTNVSMSADEADKVSSTMDGIDVIELFAMDPDTLTKKTGMQFSPEEKAFYQKANEDDRVDLINWLLFQAIGGKDQGYRNPMVKDK